MLLSVAAAQFLEHCIRERHLSPNTIVAYKQDLAECTGYFAADMLVADVRGTHLLAFHENLIRVRTLSLGTVKRRLACLKSFFSWSVRRRIRESSPFSEVDLHVRLPERLPRCLTTSEVGALMKHRSTLNATASMTLTLFVETGMRVGELATLRARDIDLGAGRLRIVGKGNRERVAFVTNPGSLMDLRDYIEDRSQDRACEFLLTRNGKALSTRQIRRIVVSAARSAGLSRRITPHMLRHTAATMLLECGTDIRYVQRLLGHRSIVTTQLYTHVTDQSLRGAIARANVIDRFGSGAR